MATDSQSVAKRHHVVPQFYLRGFAENDKLATVKLPGEQRFVQSVRRAASETNFYALPGHKDGDDVFEKMLSAVEGEAARVFADIERGVWPLPEGDRTTLAYFISVQVARGPEQRRNLERLSAEFTRLEIGYNGRSGVKGWAKRNRGLNISDEEAVEIWDQATVPGGPPIRLSALAHIEQIVKQSDELTRYIAGRPWALVHFESRSLITADVPVGLIPHPEDEPWRGVGFATAWGITFPLTRKLGLLMGDPMVIAHEVSVEQVRAGRMDSRQRGTTALEKLFNEGVASSASIWLYHHPADARFVPDRLPEASPVTSEMMGVPEDFSGEPLFS